jgi:hypothetical protein
MTAFNREKIQQVFKQDDEGVHQAFLNIAYDEWQKHDDWKLEDMVEYAGEFGEVVELALLLGKYNQQVQNGGHSQYFFNGYGGTPSRRHDYDYSVPLTNRMVGLMVKYGLDRTPHGIVVATIAKEFINRTESFNLDDRDEGDDWMPDYEDLDEKYYVVDDKWMEYLERYFHTWMEHNRDPIDNNLIT